MKKQLSEKTLWQSIMSVVALGIFILLATGSLDDAFDTVFVAPEYLGDGIYKTTEPLSVHGTKCVLGPRNKGRWHGPITITYSTGDMFDTRTEKVNMVNGVRHGRSKHTYTDPSSFKEQHYYICYNMGQPVACEKKTALISSGISSAFQVLSNKYPWYLFALNAFGFEDAYVEAYMDTLFTVLETYEFEDIDFNNYYGDVINDLEETPYDSIISLNSAFSIYQGLDEVKNSELRLAVIDRYRSNGTSTFNIVTTTYPGYLQYMYEAEVSDQDFEGFCQDLDSCMTSYGPLDLEDPLFINSVDTSMFRAILSIMDTEDTTSTEMLKSAVRVYVNNNSQSILHQVNSILKPSLLKSTPAEVAMVVMCFMVIQFIQGDIIKKSVMEAYLVNKGVISVPTVTTEFSNGNSATSVTLNGYVIEDGGAAVSSRGIAWATYYNPTINDHTETSGTGTGSFAVTLDGLTEGETYYARTYAINSAGTAYGNCISFVAQTTVGVIENVSFAIDLNVYPNPASAITTFSFQNELSENMGLTIVDLKGRVVYHNDLGSLPQGENQVKLDLSSIQSGVYNCQLTNNGTIKVTRKLVIVH